MNAPQWIGPESDIEMVKRNIANFAEPFALAGDVVVPSPTPAPPAPPPASVPPAPLPPVAGIDYSPLLQQILTSQQLQIVIIQEMQKTIQSTNEHVVNMDRTIGQTIGGISKFVAKYIAPFVGGWYVEHILNPKTPAVAGQ